MMMMMMIIIKITKAISKGINMNFGLEKCAKICLKKGRVQSKIYKGSTFEKDIKELYLRETCKYLGTEENYDTQHKNEKEKLKKEYLGRMRLVRHRIKCKEYNSIIGNTSTLIQFWTY